MPTRKAEQSFTDYPREEATVRKIETTLSVCGQPKFSFGTENPARDPAGPNLSGSVAIGFGLPATYLLMHLQVRSISRPLNHAAMPLPSTCNTQSCMVPPLALWLIKLLLLRYLGPRRVSDSGALLLGVHGRGVLPAHCPWCIVQVALG